MALHGLSRLVFLAALIAAPADAAEPFDVLIKGGTVYDGSGGAPFTGDVAVVGDRIVAIGPHLSGDAKVIVNAAGKAVAPGFINMLAHPEESLLIDGRGLSDLAQGVTLEVLGEDSMGPLSPQMKALAKARQGDIRYEVTWTTLGDYLQQLQARGISPTVASFVGEGTVRENLLGERDIQPTSDQRAAMRSLVRQAMEEGALGLTTALIYAPNTYAKTDELIDMAKVSAQCGGVFSAHIRNEGDRLLEALDEIITIAKASGGPAEVYHFKQSGKDNWGLLDAAVAKINQARAEGVRITADMYPYTASATGLDASMPAWVQDDGLEAWIARLKDPAIRKRVKAEMEDAHPSWDNAFQHAGASGVLLLGFKSKALKSLTGKTLAEVAASRGLSPAETAMDLVVEDGSRIEVAYFGMNEVNIRRELTLPWMSIDSDESAPAPEGVFLLSQPHPRAYGAFARVLGHYARDEKVLSLAEAVRRLTRLPADTLALKDRGRLEVGAYADIVVFDPNRIQDLATFARPAQLAVGVEQVLVNGAFALKDGQATRAPTGRFVRGRAWTGAPGGGCRQAASDWSW